MSILVNTKTHKALYQSTAITDEFPYTRKLFSDGWNSIIHFTLGYVTTAYQPIIFPLFLAYKVVEYRPYDNTTTDVEEYALGMLAGGFISPKYAGSGQVPNYFKLKEMKLI